MLSLIEVSIELVNLVIEVIPEIFRIFIHTLNLVDLLVPINLPLG